MSEKYLNDAGLAYFWGKIKAWANSVFALISHVHPSSAVTLMTGYSKPASGSAIAASDTLNQAIGKLEYKVDTYDDSNYVHKTGDEIVHGVKIFDSNGLALQHSDVVRGTIPSSAKWWNFNLIDSNGDYMATLEYAYRPNGAYDLKLACYRHDDTSYFSYLYCGYDENGIPYASAPYTPNESDRNSGNDILTRDWIPRDTRIVHTTGNETIDGNKKFTSSITIERSNPYIYFIETDITNFTANANIPYQGLQFQDKNGNSYADIIGQTYNDRSNLYIHIFDANGNNSTFNFYRKPDGTESFASFPTPPASATGYEVVNAAWINAKNYVDIDSAQSLGNKTFYTDVKIQRLNPYVKFIETDWQKGTPQSNGSTSYQGIQFQDKNGVICGICYYCYAQSKDSMILIGPQNASSASASGENIIYIVYAGNGTQYIHPANSGVVLLGTNSKRWKEIWCSQNSINSSSDARLKQAIAEIPDDVLDAWAGTSWVQYKLNDAVAEKGEERARLHAGMIAQDIDAAFRSRGLDVSKYGLFLYDEWDERPESRDGDGNVVERYEPAGNAYGLRYVEALCMEAAYMRRENARLKKRVADLEDRLAALELRLGSE